MEVYLRKNVAKIGFAGEVIKVGDGFARNFLIPQGLAIEVTEHNKSQIQDKIRKVENRKDSIATEIVMLADKINQITLTIPRKMHDNGQLYGAINASEIVDALALSGISIPKNQIVFDKTIKSKGSFKVTIALTQQVKAIITVIVVSE
jgi:large subunit ribosomal protein L9